MKKTLIRKITSGKKKQSIRCCHCASTLVVRNGTYSRNDPRKDTEVRVQRYLCKSPKCPWQSFSTLPISLLPIIRHTYGRVHSCLAMVKKGMNQAAIARRLEVKRGVIKRLEIFCLKFISWFEQEKKIADWSLDPLEFWSDFTRDFSQHFYPKRWVVPPSTQHIPLY